MTVARIIMRTVVSAFTILKKIESIFRGITERRRVCWGIKVWTLKILGGDSLAIYIFRFFSVSESSPTEIHAEATVTKAKARNYLK